MKYRRTSYKKLQGKSFFSVMVDKLTTYNDEMLSIYFRYVDQNKEIREILLEFPEAEWVSNQKYIFHFFLNGKRLT